LKTFIPMSLGGCPAPWRLTQAQFDEDADPAVIAHVRTCPSCSAEWSTLARVSEVTRALPSPSLSPSDHELLAAKLLGEAEIISRVERVRHTPRRAPWALGFAGVVAASAVLVFLKFHGGKAEPNSEATSSLASIRAIGPTSFSRLQGAPDELVRLDAGTIEITVGPVGDGRRLRVVTDDAVVDAKEGRLRVESVAHTLVAVRVFAGYAEVHAKGEHAALSAGDEWSRAAATGVVTAEPSIAPSSGLEVSPTSRQRPPSTGPISHKSATPLAGTRSEPIARRTVASAPIGAAPPNAAASPALPTAREVPRVPASATAAQRTSFERAWSLLRTGDAAGAATAFQEVETLSEGDAIAEDAMFWRSVALARANRKADARLALMRFVSRFPSSARIGEASAMLGWMLLDAGDVTGARAAFERAANDPVDRVRTSARQGLERLGTGTPVP
jgi:hypothetical protein